ncbi:prepilin-type N-terminal cleavage/methylation domain-containing protein [Clostridium sp. FP1]|uniref:prepilin-type N-terminal cleavage/methylation domain-containing protein n=1 Tax=Clostridium sp. FP1 TaxID=2724076 RepID=UPI0013E97848|nr:prepilin-type N-terminal cleavage/methylation domain-containing protein [Clostridium sp. FP1]MBZ9636286.1 prepilin-type N-terminal cleavage/methylation domain-containing protein [Clostridium sp. FP1]
MKVKKCSKGLTLIEVVISLAILAIIIGPILSLTLTSVKINKKSDDKLNALNLAQKRMEEAKFCSKEEIKDFDEFKKDGYGIITKFMKIENKSVSEYETVKDEDADAVVKINSCIISGCKGIDFLQKENQFITDNTLNVKLLQCNEGITLNGCKFLNLLEKNDEIKIKVNLTDSNLDVNVFNYCKDKKLKIFFVKDKSILNLNNFIGQIEHFTSSPIELEKKSYDLYEVDIKVEKKKGTAVEVLQELKGYKIIK